MPDEFGITPLGQHGGRRRGAGRPRKGEVREKRQGTNSNTLNSRGSRYVIARLMRDANDGFMDAANLLRGFYDGLISPFAAGCEMSYLRRREPNGRGSENAAKRRDWALHRLFHPRPELKAPEKAPSAASDARGEEKSMSLRPEFNAAVGTLK